MTSAPAVPTSKINPILYYEKILSNFLVILYYYVISQVS